MRNVLFILDSYRVGGTTVSTRNIVGLLDKEKYTPYVWVLSNSGLLSNMYQDCNLIKTCFIIHALMLESYREERSFKRMIAMMLRFFSHHSQFIKRILYKYAVRKCLKGYSFDTLVACAEGVTTDFVRFINHPNRVAWVRCDYINYFSAETIAARRSLYSHFQHIVCVSEKTKEGFDSVYPECAARTICINNPQDTKLLLKQSENNDFDDRFLTNKKCIVSVGRIQEIKRFSAIPSIAIQLLNKGLDFRWYIIGDGDPSEIQLIHEEIFKNRVSDVVILLGAKSNPHYYIAKADVLVTVSRSEACPRVVNEAKVLGTPVVSTDFRTIYEFIDNYENGIVTSLDNISDSIYELLNNKVLYEKITHNISLFEFDNSSLMTKIYSIL